MSLYGIIRIPFELDHLSVIGGSQEDKFRPKILEVSGILPMGGSTA